MLKKGFTLIELIIVITIIGILSVWIIIPYNLYSNIAKVKISKETIDQFITEARNSSAWLISSIDKKNLNITLFFDKWTNSIKLIGFPYDYIGPIKESVTEAILIREIKLESHVYINDIIDTSNNPLDHIIFYFRAPNWNLDFYKDDSNTWALSKIIIGLDNSTTWILSKEILVK